MPPNKLVIVESPAKAQTIKNYLGSEFRVEPSVGHVRDLASPADVPARLKNKGTYGKFSVDVEDNFKPYYEVSADKKKTVSGLRAALKEADELYLATDEDREGEAIAWHLLEVLKPKVPVKRMVFHEITPEAIQRALDNTRDIDQNLVDAQETRRILDRLFGYEISPILWRKVGRSLSAGRVQSVATRLIVDREKERMAFQCAAYWSVNADLAQIMGEGASAASTEGTNATSDATKPFTAQVVSLNEHPVAVGADFDDFGNLTAKAQKAGTVVLNEAAAQQLAAALPAGEAEVQSVTSKPYRSRPAAPFVTSSLQQEASRKLKWGAQTTMRVAQRLYEGGYITYMRTDSPGLSNQAVRAAREQVAEIFGSDQLPQSPRVYAKAPKGAQGAHEAIRPAGEHFRHPQTLQGVLAPQELALYDLIWKRTLASQMIDATGYTATVKVEARVTVAEPLSQITDEAGTLGVVLSTSGTVITSPGFRQLYQESTDSKKGEAKGDKPGADKANATGVAELPDVSEGEALQVASAAFDAHETRPPARYTEASLVRAMEQKGIGRPSTYASTIQTITTRGYVQHRGQYLVPTWLAFAVTRLLVENFAGFVDYDFTAKMEEGLDEIAAGHERGTEYLHDFYFGSEAQAGQAQSDATPDGVDAAGSQVASAGAEQAGNSGDSLEKSGTDAGQGLLAAVSNLGEIDAREINSVHITPTITLRIGRYGPYLEDAEGKRASVPPTVAPDELDEKAAGEIFAAAALDGRELGVDPQTGHTIQVRIGRYGPYVTEVLPEEPEQDVDAAETTKAGSDGELAKPKKRTRKADQPKPRTASLFKDMQPETVTLEEALQLLTLPRTLGADPESGEEITAQNGPYGPYLKKGTDSRNLPDEHQLLTITLEEALQIYSQPKQRGRRGAKPPLREFGEDPVSKKKVVVKDGRFGPYITDGTTNVTVPRAESIEGLTEERAFTLLAEKRAKDPAELPARGRKQAATKTTKRASTRSRKQ